MSTDRHLQHAAEAMIEAAELGRSVAAVLKRCCPSIYRQIRQDRRHPELLALWGRAVNVDENVGQIIVHPAILFAIGALAGVPMRARVVHAGLQHTYGYLFSLIDTPYGRKRTRWLSTDWERGFGLDETLLGEQPRAGTLLANVTWFLGQIVHRGHEPVVLTLERNAFAVAPELVEYDFRSLAVCRIVEQATAPRDKRRLSVFTDLVTFPRPPADPHADNALLIYSVQNGARAPIKLTTAFPVGPDTVRKLKASASNAGNVSIRLRYNAFVPRWYGRTAPGRRFIADPTSQN